jgi:DNA repair protein RecN (Recombination protein N)
MLLHLKIIDLATIESIAIDFQDGFSCLTGETGAGKSLFVDALAFVTGHRPRVLSVRPGALEGCVEAIFSPVDPIPDGFSTLVQKGDEWIVRRILLPNGRTRQTVNGNSVTQSQLSEVGEFLLDLVGQGEGARLQNPRLHSIYLDLFGGSFLERESYEKTRGLWKDAVKKWEEFRRERAERDRDLERAKEIASDWENLKPDEGEWEDLQTRLTVQLHAHDLLETVGTVYESLYGGEENLIARVRKMTLDLGRLEAYDPRLQSMIAPLSESQTQLRESAEECRRYIESVEFDPAMLGQIEERVGHFQRIARKYELEPSDLAGYLKRFSSVEERDEAEEEKRLYEAVDGLRQKMIDIGNELSRKRHLASDRLSEEVTGRLGRLKLEKADFRVEIEAKPSEGLPPGGFESVQFFFSANPGIPAKPLDEVASGGELSRILLVLKWILADQDRVETLIFDEVDSGIGGEVGEVVGDILSDIARTRQVITVTHLHQVARKSRFHYVIRKEQSDKETRSTISMIQKEDRVKEIARMLGGSDLTPSTLVLARELLESG